MRITINTGNAAFKDQAADETARILDTLARVIRRNGLPVPGDPIILMDYNGNRVGKAEGR